MPLCQGTSLDVVLHPPGTLDGASRTVQALMGGGVMAGAAMGAVIGIMVAGPVGVMVGGGTLGAVAGALGGAAAGSMVNPQDRHA